MSEEPTETINFQKFSIKKKMGGKGKNRDNIEYCPNGHQNNLALDGIEIDSKGRTSADPAFDGNDIIGTITRQANKCPLAGCEYH